LDNYDPCSMCDQFYSAIKIQRKKTFPALSLCNLNEHRMKALFPFLTTQKNEMQSNRETRARCENVILWIFFFAAAKWNEEKKKHSLTHKDFIHLVHWKLSHLWWHSSSFYSLAFILPLFLQLRWHFQKFTISQLKKFMMFSI
jgi:hypothetical protein